jgi:hypothetical protein
VAKSHDELDELAATKGHDELNERQRPRDTQQSAEAWNWRDSPS